MSNQTSELKIKAIIEGLDGLEKLKGAFRGLQQSIGPTDEVIRRARREVIEFVQAGKQSEQAIQGQINAFKALQTQAQIGGEVYQQLRGDIRQLQTNLREVQADFQGAASQAQIFARTLNQGIGNSANRVAAQISTLRQTLNELRIGSQEYLQTQQRIREIETVSNARTGRSRVIADNAAFSGSTLTNGYGADANLPQMPNTTAALNQRLNELTVSYANLERGGDRYLQTARQISAIQRQLAQDFRAQSEGVVQANARLAQTRAGIAVSGFGAFSAGIEDNIAIQKSIARNARKNPAIPDGPLADQPRQASTLWQSVAEAQNIKLANSNQMMGRTYGEVASAIRAAKDSSDGSIRSLQAQREAWTQLSGAVTKGSKDYREAQREIRALDKQIGGGNRLAQGAQIAGSVAAGAIFGGPEGAIGGLVGAAFGGVAGAGIGAGIGATAGQFRQAIAGTAEFAATIDKLNIALKGVAGSQAEYNRAQEAIANAGTRFNVPALEATQNFTRLAASVKGAGGNVANTKIVFDGVTQAIKATGGSTEDVNASILAMSQIFSKGKVSAEELQGQLGERLPGAVTLFAAATGRTLPQLQKDLKDGVVGLNDVMKFAGALSERYGSTADKMAKSTEDAGSRMKVALDKLKLIFGEFFKPIGAGFQDLTAKFANFLSGQLTGTATTKIPILSLISSLMGIKPTKETPTTPPTAPNVLGQPTGKTAEEVAAASLKEQIKAQAKAQQEFDYWLKISNESYKNLVASAELLTQKVTDSSRIKQATFSADLAENNAAKTILQYKISQTQSERDKIPLLYELRRLDMENARIQRDIAIEKINNELKLAAIAKKNADDAVVYARQQLEYAKSVGAKTDELMQKLLGLKIDAQKMNQSLGTAQAVAKQDTRVANAQFNAANYIASQAVKPVPTGQTFNGQPVLSDGRTGMLVNGVLTYAGGGYTGNAARSGGLDGQGGFMAMLHPRETVIDHTRTGGGVPNITIKTGEVVQMPDGSQWVSVADLEAAMHATAAGVLGQLRSPAGRVAMGGA